MRRVLAYLLGKIIRASGNINFPGKSSRAITLWLSLRDEEEKKLRVLPGGGKVLCDFSVPYECMVWLEQEEQRDIEILQRLLKPGETFVDCGANIGLWTLVAAATVGPSGRVLAFEPTPVAADKLSKNLSLSGFNNVTTARMAVGSNPEERHLQCEHEHNRSRIVENVTSTTIDVPVVTLDDELEDKRIAGCKIDVEGFELAVLKGAERLLKDYQPWICIEFNTVITGVDTLDKWDVHQYLRGAGYAARSFEDALDLSTASILPDKFKSTARYCNLFYAPHN